MVGFFGLNGGFAAVEVWHQRLKTRQSQPVGDATDLVVEAPPLLDDHDGRGVGCVGRYGQIALHGFAVGPLKFNHGSHCCSCYVKTMQHFYRGTVT